MPLSPAVARKPIHQRRYEFNGFLRDDGLWDIEGRITDTKSYAFPNRFRGQLEPGDALHDMWLRITITEDMEITAVEAVTDASPFEACPAVTGNFQRAVGLKIGPGWVRELRRRLGGVHGCTHLVEMFQAMATVAFQTIFPTRNRPLSSKTSTDKDSRIEKAPGDMREKTKRPALLDSCHIFASDGTYAEEFWPEHFTGERKEKKTG